MRRVFQAWDATSLLVFFCVSDLRGSTGGSATFLGSLFLGLEIPDDEWCRWDNSLLWDPPTESSFMGQIISSGLHHFRLFFLHTKLGKDISGTGNLDFQK